MPTLSLARAGVYLPYLLAAMSEFKIDTRPRICAFLSVALGHESQDLTRWVENLRYSPNRLLEVFPKYFKTYDDARMASIRGPEYIAERVYGGRMGNVDEGDGWKFRGRGPMGATGREMYERAGIALTLPLVTVPELVERPDIGFRVAAWIWSVDKDCNPLADQLKCVTKGPNARTELFVLTAITKRINGGTNGLADRVTRYGRALRAIPDVQTQIPAQELTSPVSGNVQTETKTSDKADAEPTQTATCSDDQDFHNDLHKLLKKESIKAGALSTTARGAKLIWRPLAALVAAIQAGNMLALSGGVLLLVALVVVACLYHKELRRAGRKAWHFVVEMLTA